MAAATSRRWLAPEVVQTSNMDCGPAALKCLLEGFHVPTSYGRLREACQTDVDGTSIDALEDVANLLGLEAEQVMVPADHLLSPEANLLPAIAVVCLTGRVTHFTVVWRRHGPLFQLMDPATGRRWVTARQLMREFYIHSMPVPACDWREWAGTDAALRVLRGRMAHLGVPHAIATDLEARALDDPGWKSIARLESAVRLLEGLVRSGGLQRGSATASMLRHFCEESDSGAAKIPDHYRSVRPLPGSDGLLMLQGAVLVHVHGRTQPDAARPALPPELAAALAEEPDRPGHRLLDLMKADGFFAPGILLGAALLAAGGVVVEAALFRGLLEIGRHLGTSVSRLGVGAALIAFVVALLLLEFPFAAGLMRMGRKLEARLRIAFLVKVPRLADRYFRSRLTSDMAHRSHTTHEIRQLPQLGGQLARRAFELVLTAAGIAWLDPLAAPWALLSATVAMALPVVAQGPLVERDLRLRNHAGALSRFYLDALLGLVPIRAHGAQHPLRREHEGQLVEWARAGFAMQRTAIGFEALQAIAGFGFAAWILFDHLQRSGEGGSVLLLLYWALHIPVLGEEIAWIARQYPVHRNLTLRLLEPLGALEEATAPAKPAGTPSEPVDGAGAAPGATLAFDRVSVRAGGHVILEDVSLEVPAGHHVAIVGPSGAGKSSLLGLLLGWHRPASGCVQVDGEGLEGSELARLRRETAWVDPSVHLWNRSLLDNLGYGSGPPDAAAVGAALEDADLHTLLKGLPQGLQTSLGEGGALVSGGEGQRVRLGRAMLRPSVRLALLDEPFRGLDRERRRELLARARRRWKGATLLCVTHDVGQALEFDRVLVLEGGRVVEDAAPGVLAERSGSRFRSLLEAEEETRARLWSGPAWRQVRLESGRLRDLDSTGATP